MKSTEGKEGCFSMQKEISFEELREFENSFQGSRANQVAMNAASTNGVIKAATNPLVFGKVPHNFSVSLEQGDITNQKQSGRCWMFSALNTMRYRIIKKLNLKTFELSQSYPLFYDKLEKANYFLESILETMKEERDGRLIAHLLSEPMNDGGQWDMLVNLVNKYGVVPKYAMPETVNSENTREMDGFLTKLLRQYACELREGFQAGKSVETLREKKKEYMNHIYTILCICLGVPPKSFDFEARGEDKTYTCDRNITPVEFFKKYVDMDLEQYISLINAPTADKPFHRTYTVSYLGNVKEGRPVKYLNLELAPIKAAAIAQLKDNEPVWFGCDVGQSSLGKKGILDVDAVRVNDLFGTEFSMNKAQRLDYGESLMTHAMVFMGVDLDEKGNPTRWRVENSWGKETGKEGYMVMSDKWFDEFVYQVVVNKKYLPEAIQKEWEQEPIPLKPWDPMGSLAKQI